MAAATYRSKARQPGMHEGEHDVFAVEHGGNEGLGARHEGVGCEGEVAQVLVVENGSASQDKVHVVRPPRGRTLWRSNKQAVLDERVAVFPLASLGVHDCTTGGEQEADVPLRILLPRGERILDTSGLYANIIVDTHDGPRADVTGASCG